MLIEALILLSWVLVIVAAGILLVGLILRLQQRYELPQDAAMAIALGTARGIAYSRRPVPADSGSDQGVVWLERVLAPLTETYLAAR